MLKHSEMTFGRLLFFLLPLMASAATSSLTFLPYPNANAVGVLPMANGSTAIYGSLQVTCNAIDPCNQTAPPLLSIADASGNVIEALAQSALGGGDSFIESAAVDASGNIWIAGTTDSDDFPLVHPLFAQKPAYMPTGFVAKLDPNLNILFSTFLGGQEIPQAAQTAARSIALDRAGNAYIAGQTADPNFPTTGPVFGTGAPDGQSMFTVTFTFVSKISADGSKLLFSRLLGGDASPCVGDNSFCFGFSVYSTPNAIAVDTSGNLTVSGATNASNFPITANVYNTSGGAYVARISADGSQLVWSTELGIVGKNPLGPLFSSAESLAVDAAGNVYIAGSAPGPIAATPGVLQPSVNPTILPAISGFVAKLGSGATQLLYATNLSGSNGSVIYGLTLDSAGNLWIAGNTRSPDFPGLSNVPSTGLDFALEVNASASSIQQIFALLPATVTDAPAFDSNGSLLLLASAGNLLTINPTTSATGPDVWMISNSALPYAAGGVAPGELLTLYGTLLGPSTGLVGQPGKNGLFPTNLGGVTVEFSAGPGTPAVSAPLLYVGPGQINLQVPFALTDPTTITITTPTATLALMTVPLIDSIGIFGVVNQDGTVNSPTNSAPVGSAVSIYLTGLGAGTNSGPTTPNGAISSSARDIFHDNIKAFWTNSGQALTVLYAGTAPGSINGLDQINVQIAANGSQSPSLTVGMVGSGTTTVVASAVFAVYTK